MNVGSCSNNATVTSLFVQRLPVSVVSLPASMRRRVDLPVPFLATSAILSPSSMLNEMFLKSGFMPYDFVNPSAET